ncbi:MAG: CBS domain-containing protein [Anaerolineae bacterium]|nr:CBS domain-containing protein [Anaerolineae bacterium]
MSNLLLVILNDTSKLPDILNIWRKIGVPGTTILKSAGGHASRAWLSRVGLGAINNLFETKEVQTRTLIAVFDNEELLAQAIAEAERIVGGFDQPNSGVVLVLPVSQAIGIYKAIPQPLQDVSPPALRSDWSLLRDTPIEKVDSLLNLEPTIVLGDTTLDDVARAMLVHPNVHVVSVVAEDGRLIGLLELSALADDLFFHILPEEFLSEITDIEKMMAFANRTRALTAHDVMTPPIWVKRGETVKEAFKRMHDNKLPGLPLVDERYHVVGYVNLLELLSLCIQMKNDVHSSEVKK